MTPTERKRLQRDREKAGLALLSMWVPRDKLAECKAAVEALCDPAAAVEAVVKKAVSMGYPEDLVRRTIAGASVEAIIEGDTNGT